MAITIEGLAPMRGDRLRALREIAGLTQEELAAAIGSSEPQVFRYEKNKNEPGADVLIRMAQFFHVSTDYLLGLTDELPMNDKHHLTPEEVATISAWRRGDLIEAIRIIINKG